MMWNLLAANVALLVTTVFAIFVLPGLAVVWRIGSFLFGGKCTWLDTARFVFASVVLGCFTGMGFLVMTVVGLLA